LARRQNGDLEGALRDYTEAIRPDPNYALAFNNRSAARAFNGDVEGATQIITKRSGSDTELKCKPRA